MRFFCRVACPRRRLTSSVLLQSCFEVCSQRKLAHHTSVFHDASHTALNLLQMVGRVLAGEHGVLTEDGFKITLCHPGWVGTDMGSAGNRAPPVSPPDSVSGMLAVLDRMGSHSNADFLDFLGKTLPW